MALLALCPLLSALLLEIWHPARDEQEEPDDRPTTWSFPFLPVALLALYKLIFYFSLSLTDGSSLFGPLGIIVISLIALIGTLFFFQSFTPTLLYRLSLPFMVAGLLLLAWLHTGSMAATMLTNASNIGFELFIFLALAQVCFRYDIDGVWMFSIVLAASSVATVLGRLAGGAFIQSFPAGSPEANLTVALVVVGLVISHSTTKTHIRHLYEKLGVHSREEARALVESA